MLISIFYLINCQIPEFSNNPKYIDAGEYIPEIVKREDISNLVLLPLEIKEKLLKDF